MIDLYFLKQCNQSSSGTFIMFNMKLMWKVWCAIFASCWRISLYFHNAVNKIYNERLNQAHEGFIVSFPLRAAQLAELSTTAGYPWKLSMSAYLQNFATKNAVFTNLRNKNAVFTHFCDKNAVFTHFCVKNLWFHRYVTICLTRASTYTFRSCFVIILSPQVRA